ncbi:MAG: hypothetical protein AB1918_04685 [Pseudomonadota bacterium]
MAAWMRQGMGLDVALAVALEIGKLRLDTAESAAERAGAMDFNERLWRTIRRLAATSFELAGRDALLSGADAAESAWSDPAAVATLNARHAGVLAGRAATQGALRRLLDDWVAHRRANPRAEFATWLLIRIEEEGAPLSLAA